MKRTDGRPRYMFYHDGRHPLIYMYEPPMQKEEYEQAVDELIGTPVEAIMFCLGDGRTVLHDTEVGELWGSPNEIWTHQIFRRAHQNAGHLIEEGNDPLRIVCERAHEKGFLLYPTLLVQQGSGERGVDTRTSNFRLENKHLEIGAAGDLELGPGNECLDFMHEEVREERFALIAETLERYEVDGFELHMNYTPFYFRPDQAEAGRKVMTAWIERVHGAVKSRPGAQGERELVIRMDNSIERNLERGLDLRAWVDAGIVDVLVPEDKGNINSSSDFSAMARLASGTDCRVHGCIAYGVDSDRLSGATIEMVRATATNYWRQEIDGMYLTQWFTQWPYESDFYEQLREVVDPEVMAPRDKYYFVPTVGGRVEGEPEPAGRHRRLPVALDEGDTATVVFTISDELARWDEVGRIHEVLLRVRIAGATELDSYGFALNGVDLPGEQLRKINRMYMLGAPRYRVGGYWFIYKLSRDFWPVAGENELAVTVRRRDSKVTNQRLLRDVELETKYLKGKSFHRSFVDPDLGAFEGFVV